MLGESMINLKDLTVGFGFIIAVIIFLVHKIKVRSAHKKKILERKNRRKRKGNKKNKKKNKK
jgi:hypothetical protein